MAYKLYIVDDEHDHLQLAYTVLKRDNYEIRIDDSPKAAFKDMTNGFRPDIIISDYQMPTEQDGIDFVKNIRTNEKTKDIPILVLSGHSCEPEIQRIMEAGNHHRTYYMTKPYNNGGLIEKVKELLEHYNPKTKNSQN